MNDQQIQSLQLIRDPTPEHFHPAGYDLTVDEIIDSSGRRIEGSTFTLDPQGIVWIVSKENVELPDGVLGYATIRTGLCNDGVLALNIGIVDPGWSGPLSTAFVNFGKEPFEFEKGSRFLRLTFHKYHPETVARPQKQNRSTYLSSTRKRARNQFGQSFLNLDKRFEREQRKALIRNIPLAGILLAGLSLALAVVALAFSYFSTWRAPTDIRQALQDSDALVAQAIESRNATLSRSESAELVTLVAAIKSLECRVAFDPAKGTLDSSQLKFAKASDCPPQRAPQ